MGVHKKRGVYDSPPKGFQSFGAVFCLSFVFFPGGTRKSWRETAVSLAAPKQQLWAAVAAHKPKMVFLNTTVLSGKILVAVGL
jgi:hypothetical protein